MAGPDKASDTAATRASISGILVVDKPVGPSSMQAVARVRRRAGGVRTGHAGTLDPLASGVLVLALGPATKTIDRLMSTSKRYRTEIDLSAFTSTDDREGAPEPVEVSAAPSRADLDRAVAAIAARREQRPPAFSAVKIAGRRAYKMARRGEAPTIAPRPVVVHAMSVVTYAWPLVTIDIHCGKGFYVRSFARDLGEALGTGGHCVSICRTAVGPFTLEMAVALDDVPEPLTEDLLLSVDAAMEVVERDVDATTAARAGERG